MKLKFDVNRAESAFENVEHLDVVAAGGRERADVELAGLGKRVKAVAVPVVVEGERAVAIVSVDVGGERAELGRRFRCRRRPCVERRRRPPERVGAFIVVGHCVLKVMSVKTREKTQF